MKGDADVLKMFVIYNEPLDYPGKVVVRVHRIEAGGAVPEDPPLAVVGSIREARDRLPPGLYRMERDPSDPLSIVETWL